VSKTIILWLADMHSGSPTALYPDETLPLMNGPRGPSRLQELLHKHFVDVLEYTALARQQADRLIVINMGDATEGLHHDSKEIISAYETDHQKIHESLMREAKERLGGWDKLYYVNGTPSHAGENEYSLSMTLGAELYRPAEANYPILKKTVAGKLIYAAHHGAAAGAGYTVGNVLRNKLKTLDFECAMNRTPSPDMVVFADKHNPIHVDYDNNFGHTIKGFILPSWKLIDAYVYRVSAFAFSRIGAMISTCTDNGIESEFLSLHIEQDPITEL
jgi:hypothetical protein